MQEYTCWMVDVDGTDIRACADAQGTLYTHDVPETHFASAEDAGRAAETTKRLYPDCEVRVNGKRYSPTGTTKDTFAATPMG